MKNRVSLDLAGLVRRRPRAYQEWLALRRWGRLPTWEADPPGYLLRQARERSDLTQAELATRLGRTQQAIAQAERWQSNPTISFMRDWAQATDTDLTVDFGLR